MRIVFLTDQAIIGGGERNLLALAKALGNDVDVTIIASNERVAEWMSAEGLKVKCTAIRSRWLKFLPVRDRALEKLVSEFDIAHAYSVRTVPALISHGKAVWTVHGPWERPYGARARMASRWLKHAIAVSEDVRDGCSFKTIPLTKITLGSLNQSQIIKPALNPEFLHRSTVCLGVLGRFQRIKGQDILLSALKLVAEELRETDLHVKFCGGVNGESDEDKRFYAAILEHIEILRRSYPRIHIEILGHTSDPLSFLDQQDLVVIPSRYESFSMVAIEALARGKPVITPRIGGPLEIVRDDCSLGHSFTPGSVQSLAHAIVETLHSKNLNSQNIYRRAIEYSAERQAQEHLRLYQTL